jgi:hypothetical protein
MKGTNTILAAIPTFFFPSEDVIQICYIFEGIGALTIGIATNNTKPQTHIE